MLYHQKVKLPFPRFAIAMRCAFGKPPAAGGGQEGRNSIAMAHYINI